MPPHTDTRGRGTIRVGTDCKPLTGTLRRRLVEGVGGDDFTAETIDVPVAQVISAVAMESLRAAAAAERAPAELLGLGDEDLLTAIGVLRDGRPTRAAVLLAGSPEQIRAHVPHYDWTHLRMSSDTEYADRADGNEALTVALSRMLDRIMADNPIETVRRGLYHFEYRTYPKIALREALLNALCHGDFRIAGPRMIRQFAGRIEISNPGGMVGGVTPDNVLRCTPTTRNRRLVAALVRLRLVNRSSIGMRRIFSSLLVEGKDPPEILDSGDSVHVTLRASRPSIGLRSFVGDQATQGRALSVEELLVFRHLLDHPGVDAAAASELCRLTQAGALEVLSRMERDSFLVRRETGPDICWILSASIRDQVLPPLDVSPEHGIDWETLRMRVLREIQWRAVREEPLTNADVRRLTKLDRYQVIRLIRELVAEGHVRIEGQGRGARYVYQGEKA